MKGSEYLRKTAKEFEADAKDSQEKHPNVPTAGMVLENAAHILKLVANALELNDG